MIQIKKIHILSLLSALLITSSLYAGDYLNGDPSNPYQPEFGEFAENQFQTYIRSRGNGK